MAIKTQFETGTLTTYPNQYRFVSNTGEDVRIFRKTPLHLLEYEIRKGTSAEDLVKLGEQFKFNSLYLLRFNSGKIQWGSATKKTKITFASKIAEEDSEEIIKYLEENYVAFNSYSLENYEWLKEHLNEIKKDLRDTFNIRVRLFGEKMVEVPANDVQSTFQINNSELEELRMENKELKEENTILQKTIDDYVRSHKYSAVSDLYLREIGSLRCRRCGHKLQLRVSKKGRNRGVVFFGCEDYQYNGHKDCRYILEIDGLVYVMHQKLIDDFLSKSHYDLDGNLIENVRLPLPVDYYKLYLRRWNGGS